MALVFFCQSCGSRFEVDARLAGKKGHCKSCGQLMTIPAPDKLASMVAMPVPAMAGARAAAVGAVATSPRPKLATGPRPRSTEGGEGLDWLKAAATNVGLAPLTIDGLFNRKKVSTKAEEAAAEFENENSAPYLVKKPTVEEKKAHRGKGVNKVAVVWRGQMGIIERTFRWLNNSAYFVSVPFLVILLLGGVTKSRPMALFGATFVVLLNVGRFIAGICNLIIVPIREGTNTSGKRLKKPFRRVLEPVLTVAAVLAMFTFLPWLSGGSNKGTILDRVKSEARSLGNEMKGEVKSTVEKAKNLDVNTLKEQAEAKFKSLGKQATEGMTPPPAAPVDPASKKADAIGNIIKDVAKQARETINEAQGRP